MINVIFYYTLNLPVALHLLFKIAGCYGVDSLVASLLPCLGKGP